MSLLLCYEIVYGRLPVQTRWLVDCRYIGGVDGPQDHCCRCFVNSNATSSHWLWELSTIISRQLALG